MLYTFQFIERSTLNAEVFHFSFYPNTIPDYVYYSIYITFPDLDIIDYKIYEIVGKLFIIR